jgi:flagellar biosynthesis/type III secretory pathway protein FliH
VEIARKILAQRIDKGDYDIEQIVREAIKNTPSNENLVVHVNPEDLTLLRLACGKSDRGDNLEGVKLFADTKIGRAECLVESPKGLIESRINEQLEQIANALKKAQ